MIQQFCSQGYAHKIWKQGLNICIPVLNTHKSQKVGTTQTSINRWTATKNVIYSLMEYHSALRRKENMAHAAFGWIWKHHTAWSTPGTKGQILHDSIYMKHLECRGPQRHRAEGQRPWGMGSLCWMGKVSWVGKMKCSGGEWWWWTHNAQVHNVTELYSLK